MTTAERKREGVDSWHDTELCGEPGCGGPIVPFYHDRPHLVDDVCRVMCAACGTDYIEDDVESLARIWWSAGAWEGRGMEP